MKHKNSRCKLELKGAFTQRTARFLRSNSTYNYYRISVWLNQQGFLYFTEFIRILKQYSSDLFYNIFIEYNKRDHSNIQTLLQVYFSKCFNKDAIKFYSRQYISEKLMYIDRVTLYSNKDSELLTNNWFSWTVWRHSITSSL